MRLAITVAMALMGASCTTTGVPVQQRQAAIVSTIPTCSTDRECELKWSAARQWILSNAPMKLQHLAPDFMETYNPRRNSIDIGVRVVKEPMPQGGYRIVATIWCDNIYDLCRPNKWDALQNFNDYVNAAGARSERQWQQAVAVAT